MEGELNTRIVSVKRDPGATPRAFDNTGNLEIDVIGCMREIRLGLGFAQVLELRALSKAGSLVLVILLMKIS